MKIIEENYRILKENMRDIKNDDELNEKEDKKMES